MPFHTFFSASFFDSSSNVDFPTNLIHNFQMASTAKVRGMVTAQNIQKFGDTVAEPVDVDEEKSNIDMLNIDYDLDENVCNVYAERPKHEK